MSDCAKKFTFFSSSNSQNHPFYLFVFSIPILQMKKWRPREVTLPKATL